MAPGLPDRGSYKLALLSMKNGMGVRKAKDQKEKKNSNLITAIMHLKIVARSFKKIKPSDLLKALTLPQRKLAFISCRA